MMDKGYDGIAADYPDKKRICRLKPEGTIP
jgi:hypothetical protein